MSDVGRGSADYITKESEQYVLNYSFDEVFKILTVALVAYNPNTNTMDRVQIGTDGGIKQADSLSTGRYDLQAPVYYVGSAPVGTAESAASWTVVKFDLSANPYSSKTATNIAWSARTGATYV